MYSGTCNQGIFAGLAAFGAVDFNADLVWQNWLAGASGNNAAGMQAANGIRAALAQLGYGTFTMNVNWGSSQDNAAWGKFAAQQGVPSNWPTKAAVIRLGQLVQAGGTPGGGPSVDYQVVDGEFIKQSGSSGGKVPLLAALALAAVGGYFVLRERRKSTRVFVANRAVYGLHGPSVVVKVPRELRQELADAGHLYVDGLEKKRQAYNQKKSQAALRKALRRFKDRPDFDDLVKFADMQARSLVRFYYTEGIADFRSPSMRKKDGGGQKDQVSGYWEK